MQNYYFSNNYSLPIKHTNPEQFKAKFPVFMAKSKARDESAGSNSCWVCFPHWLPYALCPFQALPTESITLLPHTVVGTGS